MSRSPARVPEPWRDGAAGSQTPAHLHDATRPDTAPGYLAGLWPPAGITIRTPDLDMRPISEPDAAWLATALPPDIEQNPHLPRYPGIAAPAGRRVTALQEYWRNRGAWERENWCLTFGAWLRADEPGSSTSHLIGTQTLEGTAFARLRVVDSASLLLTEYRRRGLGKQMRRGVLTLAFGHLGAVVAVSAAWHDNPASLGVSRSLGYEDNGVDLEARGENVEVMQRVRLTREAWEQGGLATGIEVSGVEAALPFFGLDAP
jgi:RimJ/RimL family protein N-acetyltransferase